MTDSPESVRALAAIERLVLDAMRDDGLCYSLDTISLDADLPREVVRGVMRGLVDKKQAQYHRGLFREDGEGLAGSGYAITDAGVAARAALLDRAPFGVREAAEAGWNACRKSIYAVCEDVQEEFASDPHESNLEARYRAGARRAAKSIARGFNSMEAKDDDNLADALARLSAEASPLPREDADDERSAP